MAITTGSNDRSTQQHVIYEGTERRSGAERRRTLEHEEKVTAAAVTGGSTLELIGGGAAVVLTIIGLAGFLPFYMTSIATIAIGGALLAHGAAVAARWNETMRQVASDRRHRVEVSSGVGSEMLGGAAAVALGIIALAGVMPFVLLAVAAIVLGGSIVLGAPAHTDLARMASEGDRLGKLTYEAVEGSSGAMVLAGVGAIVLGILALINVGPPFTLVMVSILAIGAAVFLGGSALTARFARRLQHAT